MIKQRLFFTQLSPGRNGAALLAVVKIVTVETCWSGRKAFAGSVMNLTLLGCNDSSTQHPARLYRWCRFH